MRKEKNNLPKISIVIPSYNKADFIGVTLSSIIGQGYPGLEVIIQDGGSDDGTLGIIKKFTTKYPNIIKGFSRKDGGQVDAINTGLKKATGKIITYINADDIYTRGALMSVGKFFMKNPETIWLTGYGDIIDEHGQRKSFWVTKYKNFLLKINKFPLLLMVNFITQPSTFLSREAYEKYGPFMGTNKFVMEYDLWLKLGKVQMPGVIKKYLASFRLTMDNISATSFNELLALDYQITKGYSKNPLILFIHYLHNFGRIGLMTVLKKYD